MATTQYLGEKEIFEPGSYGNTESGIQAEPASATYGNVLIIDTGLGARFGAGSGVDGQFKRGKDSVSEFSSLAAFSEALGGGAFAPIAKALYKPSKQRSVKGVNKVFFVKCATTTAASLKISFGLGATSDITIAALNEGLCANGTLLNGELTRGYAARMRKAPQDNTLYILDFFRGQFGGSNDSGEAILGTNEEDSKPKIICSSAPFKNTKTLTDWMLRNREFNQHFMLQTALLPIDVVAADLTANINYQLFAGGTELYDETLLGDVLDSVADVDYTFLLSDQSGSAATGLTNTQYMQHLLTEAVNQKYMVIAGGSLSTDAEQSIDAARYFDSSRAIIVHGAVGKTRPGRPGFMLHSSLYKAALVLGRICGISPETPVTFKDLDYEFEVHDLKAKERRNMLNNGVLHTKKDGSVFVVNEGINSLQLNDKVINIETGESHLISVERIGAHLNKQIVLRGKEVFLKANTGPNRSTVSAEIYQTWLNNELNTHVAGDGEAGLIRYFDRVIVIESEDTLRATYRFEPNFEVNKLLNTGFIIDRSL